MPALPGFILNNNDWGIKNHRTTVTFPPLVCGSVSTLPCLSPFLMLGSVTSEVCQQHSHHSIRALRKTKQKTKSPCELLLPKLSQWLEFSAGLFCWGWGGDSILFGSGSNSCLPAFALSAG